MNIPKEKEEMKKSEEISNPDSCLNRAAEGDASEHGNLISRASLYCCRV
jgi:hypothetical protein